MSKQSAYEEMCKKPKGEDGKYAFIFDEIADIAERHMGKKKSDTLAILTALAKKQKKVKPRTEVK